MRTILGTVFGACSVDVFGGQGESTPPRPLETTAHVDVLYMRGLAKVAFHYFLWASPVVTGHEPAFASIKAFISEGVGPWQDFVEFAAPQFIPPLAEGKVPVRTSHYFCGILTKAEAVAHVQFFASPDGVPPPSHVKLAHNPLMIDARHITCHEATYFDDESDPHDGHQGELTIIEAWPKKIITPR